MSVTATSAPTRKRHSQFEVITVILSALAFEVHVAIKDEDGDLVRRQGLSHTGTTWQSLSYDSDGDLIVTTSDAPVGSLAADFSSFAGTAGSFATRAQALENRLVLTGRLPS